MNANKPDNKKNGKKGKRIALWVVIVVLVLVLLFALLIWWALAYTESLENRDPEATPTAVQQETEQEEFNPITGAMEDISVPLARGLQLINIGSYTGAYVEDGTNEVVSGVLMLVVTNTGAEAIEYAQISMPAADGTAQFSISTLMPGASAVLLEQDRMLYTGNEDPSQAEASAVAVFDELPSMCEEQLELQILDGAINVKNISGGDITGDILIYYKNSSADLYYGGITYRVRIEGGMKDGEIKQLMASHFSASGSKIVFVTIN